MTRKQTIMWSLPLVLVLALVVQLLGSENRNGVSVGGSAAVSAAPAEILDAPAEAERRLAAEKAQPNVRPRALIRGRVDSSVGEWWRGASVFAVTASKRGAQCIVNEEGRFAMELELPSDDCEDAVTLTLDTLDGRRLRQETAFQPDPEESGRCAAEVVFVLQDRCGVRGVALDESGAPIGGVLVAAIQLSSLDHSYQVLAEKETDQGGKYELDFEPKPDVLLALVHREYQAHGITLGLLLDRQLDLGSIVLVRGEVIEGTLLSNEAESSFDGLEITARGTQHRVISLGSGISGFSLGWDGNALRHFIVRAMIEHGRFRLPGLEAKEYSLDLSRQEGFASLPGLITNPTKAAAPANLTFDPTGPQLWFRLSDAQSSRPVRARITVAGAFGEQTLPTDRMGGALILMNPEADYRILIESPGYARLEFDLTSPPVNGFRIEERGLEPLRTGRVEAKLTRPWTGRARLELELQSDTRSTIEDLDVTAGALSLEDLAPGFYTARLSLWGAGMPGPDGTAEDVVLTFDCRVVSDQTTSLGLVGP